MGIEVRWDNEEHTALLLSFREPWDWEQFADAMQRAWRLIDDTPHRVTTIVDFTDSRTLPRGALKRFGEITENLHPRQDRIVVVGASPFIQAIGALLSRLYPTQARKVLTAHTLDGARLRLNRRGWLAWLRRWWHGGHAAPRTAGVEGTD